MVNEAYKKVENAIHVLNFYMAKADPKVRESLKVAVDYLTDVKNTLGCLNETWADKVNKIK